MKLRDGLWLEGAYYIDIDRFNQLRIAGPENHLYFGSVGLDKFDIQKVGINDDGELELELVIPSGTVLHDPLMGHMRKVRSYTEFDNRPTPTFAEVAYTTTALFPTEVRVEANAIRFRRTYGSRYYGVRLEWGTAVTADRNDTDHTTTLQSVSAISLLLRTQNSHLQRPVLGGVIAPSNLDFKIFGKHAQVVERLWARAGVEVEHLVQYNKTSGYEYGTVFPRDWMEAADLAGDDITPEAARHMYRQSMLHIDDAGSGWHENIIGEYEFEEQTTTRGLEDSLKELIPQANVAHQRLKELVGKVRQLYINRNMIDIEPRYMMGLDAILATKPTAPELERLRRTARYITEQALDQSLITFKRLPDFSRRHRHDEEYFKAGNWRDSDNAFKLAHPVLAPYDVNAVFYPQALRSMLRHAAILKLDSAQLEALIRKWAEVKRWYEFTNPDHTPAYALALYDLHPVGEAIRYRKLKVNHTDEAYDLFYGEPSESDVLSFAKRLVDPEYFYTASGPTIVGAGDGYTTEQYHGRVIWTKQTAFTVAGLARQLERKQRCSNQTIDVIRTALVRTAQASIDAFLTLDTVPELHYDKGGSSRFFNDQPMANGPMNTVQLWSAVGARRIIKEYIKVAANG